MLYVLWLMKENTFLIHTHIQQHLSLFYDTFLDRIHFPQKFLSICHKSQQLFCKFSFFSIFLLQYATTQSNSSSNLVRNHINPNISQQNTHFSCTNPLFSCHFSFSSQKQHFSQHISSFILNNLKNNFFLVQNPLLLKQNTFLIKQKNTYFIFFLI